MIRKNWFRNAACRGDGAKPNYTTDVAASGIVWNWAQRNGWCATSKDGSIGSYVEWALNVGECAEKPMVFACELGYVGPDTSRGEVVQIIGTGGVSLAALPAGRPAQRKQLLRFTAPADGNLQIRFRGPRGDGDTPGQLAVYEPQLELAETYDSRGATPAYFNGDTYPIAGGGLSLLAVYPHHLELEVVA